MNTMIVNDAIGEALAEEMRRDPRVLMFGEGVAVTRQSLLEEFGAERVRNTPLAEGIIAGTAAGAAAMGLRPVIDLLFAPFLALSMDAIMNSAGKLRYLSGGQFAFPMVVLSVTGAGWATGGQHNHNLEAMFVHAPGLKVVMPSDAADFKGLLKAAIRDDNPVLMFVDMALAYAPGEVPDGEHVVPLGQAKVVRAGADVTLVSYAKTVGVCADAARQLAAAGVDAEVIDLRTLKPLDDAAILRSVRKTGRLVVVHEAAAPCGVGAEVAAIVSERAFETLKAPVRRIAGPDAARGGSPALEQAAVPSVAEVVRAASELVAGERMLAA